MKKTNIGFLNIMPNAIRYEALVRSALSELDGRFELHPIRLKTHGYGSAPSIGQSHATFGETIARVKLDLLIVTGAPVEDLAYEDITYWPELAEIIGYAGRHIRSTAGICFGGLAIGKCLGIDKRLLDEKLFGLRPLQLAGDAGVYAGTDAAPMPFSTWAVLDSADVEAATRRGVRVIARDATIGGVVLETEDRRYFIVLGHPEYRAETLREEWLRDLDKGIPYTARFSEDDFVDIDRCLRPAGGSMLSRWIESHIADLATASEEYEVSL